MFLLIWILYVGSVNSLSENSSKLCFLGEGIYDVFCKNSSTELSCSDDHLIRIKDIQIEITNKSSQMNDCGECPPNDESGEWKNETDIKYFETLLYQSCSRKSVCTFTSYAFRNVRYIWTANVKYDCVEKELFKDICSPWTKKTDSVHIYLDRTNNASKTCSCTIEGDTENTKMAIVDYRPYTNNFSCAGSSVVVDGKDMFQCTENGTNFSVFNKNMTIINNVTKIAVSFSDDLPQMLWIHFKGINMTVQCSNEDVSSTFPSSSSTDFSTIDTISTDTLTISPENDTPSVTTNTESNTVTTTFSLSYEENEHENVFSLLVIAGGSAGLLAVVVIITVTICFLCRRKSNRTTKDKNKENMYAEFNAQTNTANILTIKSGVINQGYETENKIGDFEIKDLSNSNYEEVGKKKEESDDGDDDNVYAEPADVVADNMYAETSETETLRPQTEQKKIEGVNYTEPYDKFVITDNGSQNNYAKVIKSDRKKDAYDTCAGIDNYSHILIDMKKQIPKTEDTYSHMEFPGKNHGTSCLDNYSHTKVRPLDGSKVQKCTGMYINVKINTTQQDLIDRETVIEELDNNSASLEEEEGEYDHLDHLSYHSVI